MFGGTAKTYINWEWKGQPFEEDKKLYIIAIHPKTKAEKKVRFYADKAHNDLKPQPDKKPLHTVFFFTSENGYINAIQDKYLTDEEKDLHFHRQWRYCTFFGGTWYAAAETSLPPIANSDKYFEPTWLEWKNEGQINSLNLGLSEPYTGVWFD